MLIVSPFIRYSVHILIHTRTHARTHMYYLIKNGFLFHQLYIISILF